MTKKTSLTYIGIAIIVLVIGIAIFSFLSSQLLYKADSTTVVKQMRELSRYETASFTLEKVIDVGTTSNNSLKNFFFEDKLLLIAHGEVIAGFDLSQIEEDDIQIVDSVITVQFPEPFILLSRLDNEKTRIYDRNTGVFSKGDKDLETEARTMAEKEIIIAACEADILTQASDNAKKQLTALLLSLEFTEVTIKIPKGTCP